MFCFLSPLWQTKKLSALIRSKTCLFSQWQKRGETISKLHQDRNPVNLVVSFLSLGIWCNWLWRAHVRGGGGRHSTIKGERFIATSELPTAFCILPICPNSLTNSCDRELSYFLLFYSATDGTRSTKVQHENTDPQRWKELLQYWEISEGSSSLRETEKNDNFRKVRY